MREASTIEQMVQATPPSAAGQSLQVMAWRHLWRKRTALVGNEHHHLGADGCPGRHAHTLCPYRYGGGIHMRSASFFKGQQEVQDILLALAGQPMQGVECLVDLVAALEPEQ